MAKRKTVTQRDPLGKLQSTYEEEAEEDAILKDGETLRVPMYMMDGTVNPELTEVQRAIATSQNKLLVSDGSNDPLALNRPGFRYSTDPAARAAADAALERAYQEVEARDANAWQSSFDEHPLNMQNRGLSPGPKQGDLCTIDGKRGRLQMVGDKLECVVGKQQDAQTLADCYAEYDREAENAWRT